MKEIKKTTTTPLSFSFAPHWGGSNVGQNKAFTLVELIVVITILAILWTIAFISFQWYSWNARDWVRLWDLKNVEIGLELFIVEKWFYPTPDNAVNITYSWAIAWNQWTLWDTVTKKLQKISKKPTDPLTGNEYSYSVTWLWNEYQIWAIAEGGSLISYKLKAESRKLQAERENSEQWINNNELVIANDSEAIHSLESPHLASPKGRGIEQLVQNHPSPLVKEGIEQVQWISISSMEWQISCPQDSVGDDCRESGDFMARNFNQLSLSFHLSAFSSFVPQTEAAGQKTARAMVIWNYNWKIIRISSGSTDYILAVPSIINWDVTNTDIISILNNNSLVYSNYSNLPASYANKWYTMTGWFNFAPSNILVYTGDVSTLTQDANKLILINNLKQAYSWTIIKWELVYKDIINSDITANQAWAIALVNTYLQNWVWWIPRTIVTTQWQSSWTSSWYSCATNPTFTNIWTLTAWSPTSSNQTWSYSATPWNCTYTCINWYTWSSCSTPPPNSCATNPTFTNIWTLTAWSPTSSNQTWSYSATPWNCTYTCINWYTWSSCSTPPPNTYLSCTSASQIITALTTYWSCDSQDIIVCSWTATWYTLSACNVWTNISGTWASSYWNYFQWWRNKWFANWDATQQPTTIDWSIWLNAWTDTYWFVWNTWLANTWATTDITNNWWDTTNTSTARQWPCATNYHIPSQPEFQAIVTAWWWGTNWTNMMNALKMPMAGAHSRFNSTYGGQSTGAYYWSSSPNDLYFSTSGIRPTFNDYRTGGLSLRCLKN